VSTNMRNARVDVLAVMDNVADGAREAAENRPGNPTLHTRWLDAEQARAAVAELIEAAKRCRMESDEWPAGFDPSGDTWWGQMHRALARVQGGDPLRQAG
jgi:hypothetical protein